MKWDNNGIRIAVLIRWALPPILSAAMLVLAFPPFDWPLFAWVALVPFFLQLQKINAGAGLCAGWLTGTLFYMGLMAWTAAITDISASNFLILGIVLGSFFSLFAGLCKWLSFSLPKWAPLALPSLWVSIEYLRSHIGFLSQPFGILGYSQYTLLPIASIAAYTGVLGVSFLVVAVNAMFATVVNRWVYCAASGESTNRLRSQPIAALLAVTILICGWFGFHTFAWEVVPPKQTFSVAIVQGNAVSRTELSHQRYRDEVLPVYERLTRTAGGASLVVWPSASVPGIIPDDLTTTRRLGALARENNTFLLIGAAGFDKFTTEQRRRKRTANSAFLFSPSGSLHERYDKIRLLPFDEYLPGRGVIPWPEWIVSKDMTDSAPGKKLTLFSAGAVRFGVQICFENMFSDQSRQLALKGADFLVGQTNEAYTDSLAGLNQNLAYNVFRAIENRMPVLRSSTTGISCIIDAAGRIVASVQDAAGRKVNVAGLATAKIEIGSERSFYTRYGDLFTYLCMTVTGILLALSFRRAFALRINS